MRWLVLLVFLASCHHEVKQTLVASEENRTEMATTTDTEVAETKKQGPSETETKTSREEEAVVVQDPDGAVQVARVPKDKPLVLKRGAKVVGTVALAKTTVDQDKRSGPTEVLKTEGKKSTETGKSDDKVKEKRATDDILDAGPGLKFYFFLGLGIVVILAAGYLYLKFVKKAVWL